MSEAPAEAATASSLGWQFWIDRGGTFTDIVARAPDGSLQSRKLLSENPHCYRDAAVQGIRGILDIPADEPIPAGTIESVRMGTTVATNALLERNGEPTLLLTTRGLGDLLRIGYQDRPRLFDLQIRLPGVLHDATVEIDERLDAHGDVIQPLDEAQVREALRHARQEGYQAVAVALMHGYRYPVHEKRIGVLAREAGFTQISLSHEVSPMIKLVSRGDTTVVDAYLSPVLRRYVEQIAEALNVRGGGCDSLLFMQSNGGLTDAACFQGRDAIFSGPAGGVVGMVRTAESAGFHRLIGFDMGGTSTDVCHYAGEFERALETAVAGVRMRVPMMDIHTVAAGGGSILAFRQGRLQVGPASAGADPGPASYRRGGPLTVTDCNVVLGKLQPSRFPRVFGPNGDRPLDEAAARSAFQALAAEIAAETGDPPMSVETLAEGFLRVAVENMARAIKKISVEQGHDVTGYTLNCFGGAGGQHACQVADVLGMEEIYLHPFAGVLSAYGMGLADIREIREAPFSGTLDEAPAARAQIDRIAAEAGAAVCAQGIGPDRIRLVETAQVRAEGAYQALPVPFGTPSRMRAAFDRAHRARFGFVPGATGRRIDGLSVEAIGSAGNPPGLQAGGPAMSAAAHCALFTAGGWWQAPILEREALRPGQPVDGPAIVVEATATTIVEPGWHAEALADGALVLRRITPRDRQQDLSTAADPVMLEVFNNLFMSIAEQMGVTLANTAHSVNIKERRDFSCAIFDADGNLVANAPHVPVHLGSMGESVRRVLADKAGSVRPGDVFMLNNPYRGGTHLPDVTVITPVFDDAGEEILFVTASRGHHADIGGKTPGSGPADSQHIAEEGVLIDGFLLVDQGRLRDAETRALLGSGPYPCRNIEENMADLAAQIAANATGVRELQRMVEQFGLAVVQAYMRHVQDNAEESVRRVIDALTDGHCVYPLDDGSRIEVTITVDHVARTAGLDFAGTSPQHAFNYNAPAAICRAVVLYVFRTLVGEEIPLNEGCLKPLSINAPEGSMINPAYPAAVIAGNTEVSQAIADALYGALGVLAGSQGTMNNVIYGNDRWQNYETLCGGTGAGDGFDGADAVHSHMTNTRMTDPEILEDRFPLRLETFAIRRGSGGQGTSRGGDGIIRRLRFLEPTTVTLLGSHRQVPPPGMAGGQPGATGGNFIDPSAGGRRPLAGNDGVDLGAGDCLVIQTPGGGGYGPPGERAGKPR